MKKKKKKLIIVMAEDDEDDKAIIQEASVEAGITIPIYFVENGEELMDLLLCRNKYSQSDEILCPVLILLDFNMPKLDGRKALVQIKKDKILQVIPIIILTTTSNEEEIKWAYNAGANSFIIKPFTFDSMIDLMKGIKNYWLKMVVLP